MALDQIIRLGVTVVAILIPLFIIAIQKPVAENLRRHGALMTTAIITLSGFGFTAFRNLPIKDKFVRKAIHASCNFSAFVVMAVGIYIIHDHKEKSGFPHFTSVHSWLGMLTIVMFGLMFIFGAVAFNPFSDFPNEKVRRILKPFHVFLGVGVFGLGYCTWGSGILQYGLSNDMPEVTALFGVLAMFVVLFTLIYRKPSKANEEK